MIKQTKCQDSLGVQIKTIGLIKSDNSLQLRIVKVHNSVAYLSVGVVLYMKRDFYVDVYTILNRI